MSLKSYWPFPSFREGQDSLLQEIEDAWNDNDVLVVRAPTATGKLPISIAIQNWQLEQGSSAAICVPNNVLREQNCSEFPHLQTVKAMKDYWIEEYNMSEADFRKKIYQWGPKGSKYNSDRAAVKRVGTPVCVNYYSYIAHKLQRNVAIVDEAHLLLGTLQDFAARKIWKHKFNYPTGLKSLKQVKEWADTLTPTGPVKQLQEELRSLTPATLVQITTDMYRGKEMPCIKLIPRSVENRPPIFWPSKTEKIVLLSATIGEKDIQFMGLANRRVKFIDVKSPIPAERRAIKLDFVGNMSYATQDANLDALIEKIRTLRDSHDGNGFVHASYSLAQKIKARLNEPWAMFHDRDNKQSAYNSFSQRPASDRAVMIGSGMSEGVDMKEEVARWQAIAKIPFPSLGEPAVRWVANNDRDYYGWMVARDVMQSAGRVCRSPDDFGHTYILDSSWDRWYTNTSHMLPQWFTEAIV